MQAFNSNGTWWLPETPAETMAGTLRFSEEDGAELSLFGELGVPATHAGEKSLPIILGRVHDSPFGKQMTLQGCWLKAHSRDDLNREKSDYRETYWVKRLFAGAHIGDPEAFSFSSLQLSLSGLNSWAWGLTGLEDEII